jgi:predicted esterase
MSMTETGMRRREFIALAAAAPLAFAAACSPTEPQPVFGPARLRLSARKPTRGTTTGTDVLYGQDLRRAYYRVPLDYDPAKAAPLIIEFHGLGGRGDSLAEAFGSRTDALGAIVLAVNSNFLTWDYVDSGEFVADMPFINDALDQLFDRCNIDVSRIALLGFSDGASYALTVGLANGDQLAGVVAFSPGFYGVVDPHGTPDIFVSHGINDTLLPVELSRENVPALEARGCDVTYVEFDGGHEVTEDVADQAMAWLTAR